MSHSWIKEFISSQCTDPAVAYCIKRHPNKQPYPIRAALDTLSAAETQATVEIWNKNLAKYASKGRHQYGDTRPGAEILRRFTAPLSGEAVATLGQIGQELKEEATSAADSRSAAPQAVNDESGRTATATARRTAPMGPTGVLNRECAHCKRRELVPGQFKTCSGCRQVAYCCKEDQLAHWKKHRPVCGSRKRNTSKSDTKK